MSGVVFRLRPFVTATIFTVISTICELFLVSAVLVFIGLAECRVLSKGKRVSLTTHSRRTKAIQVVTFVSFIAIELLTAVKTEEVDGWKLHKQMCISVHARGVSAPTKNQSLLLSRQTVVSNCLNMKGEVVNVLTGNMSATLEDGEPICESNWTFRYQNGRVDPQIIPNDAAIECKARLDQTLDECVAVYFRERTVIMSLVFRSNRSNAPKAQIDDSARKVETVSTELNFDPQQTGQQYAKELLDDFKGGITDELDIRSRLFLSTEETKCMYGPRTTFNLIPNWVLAMNTIIWVLSLALFTVTRFLKRCVFFNMEVPKHWATKIDFSLSSRMRAKRTHVYSVVEDGVRLLYLRDGQHAG